MKSAILSSSPGNDQAGESRTGSSTSPVTREDASMRVEEKANNHPVVLFLILSPELSTHPGDDRRKEEKDEGGSTSGSVPGRGRVNKADDKKPERENIAHQGGEEGRDGSLRGDQDSDKTRRVLSSDASKDGSFSSVINRSLPSASPLNSFLTTLSSKLDYSSSKDVPEVKERTPLSYDTVHVRTKYYDAPVQFVFHSLEPSTAHHYSLFVPSSSPSSPLSSSMDILSSCLLDSHPEALIVVYSHQCTTTPSSAISSSSSLESHAPSPSSSSLLQETVSQSETSSAPDRFSELSSRQTYLSNTSRKERKHFQKFDSFSSFSRRFLSNNSKGHIMQKRKTDTDRSLLPLPEALRRCPYTLRSDCVEEKREKKEKGYSQSGKEKKQESSFFSPLCWEDG